MFVVHHNITVTSEDGKINGLLFIPFSDYVQPHHPASAFLFQTTLAHIIASASKKNGTARFVTLSATSASTSEVREVIKQAQNELRLCKRKTILFIDEIHRFNKSQQVTY